MEEYTQLLEACPNQVWRTIIALARIGGLRCPSELKRLRWSDIDWSANRFLVHSPKTEHHERHRKRIIPLFPELRLELERLFSQVKSKGSEFVLQRKRGTTWQLFPTILKIAEQAGLGTLVKPFINMRKTRSNEVLARWGAVKESLWIGHSDTVMRKFYAWLEDDDFAEAAGKLDASISHASPHAKSTDSDGL
jgi:integrase